MRLHSHLYSFSFLSQPQRRDQEEAVAAVTHQATAVDILHLTQAAMVDLLRVARAMVVHLQAIHIVLHRPVLQDPIVVLQAVLTVVHQVQQVFAADLQHLARLRFRVQLVQQQIQLHTNHLQCVAETM